MCLLGRTAAKRAQKNRLRRFRRPEMQTAGPKAVRNRDAAAEEETDAGEETLLGEETLVEHFRIAAELRSASKPREATETKADQGSRGG
ncbi:hypothetical protein NDU88_006122 [Pleurodeles waltl]|uniref:Uncharacterized protein n=1 Tax=Pleurodeles waltl TaxID=8319 RepID=A0AAV7N2I7_PLEWA|nr:hypothetical protein NDU88_006122 [Pleurodeles waltl]